MTENEKLIKRIENYRDGHCVVQLDALLAEGGNPLVYKCRIDSCNQIIAALRRTAEDDKAREDGRLVECTCGDCAFRKTSRASYKIMHYVCGNPKSPCRRRLVSPCNHCEYAEKEQKAALGGGEDG